MNIFRRQTINDYIQSNGKATYDELMELIPDISCMTLRRDLEHLEKEGLVLRVRGGARSVSSISGDSEDKYAVRAAANITAKTDIAEKTLPYVQPEHSVYFDSGSTLMLLSSKLENGYYSIITPAPNLVNELLKKSKIDITLLGGRLSRDTLAVTGNAAIEAINEINIDTAIMATSGYSIDCGFTSGEYNEVQLKKAVMRKARRVVMIMDSSKFDKNLPYTFGTMKDIDVLITDKMPPQELLDQCEEHGVEVVY